MMQDISSEGAAIRTQKGPPSIASFRVPPLGCFTVHALLKSSSWRSSIDTMVAAVFGD